MRIHISTFPDLQLKREAFSTPSLSAVSLPGMEVRLTGNVVTAVQPKLSYTGDSLHGWRYYVLEYEIPASMLEGDGVPELIIGLEKLAVETKTGLEGTSMPILPTPSQIAPVVNDPPIQCLSDLSQADLTVEDADRLINLMREGLINLKDETGKFLYTCKILRLHHISIR